ncbi:acVLRF1 family peptidyl-tRNA hydrolase [Ornithinimicrobium murale]|uniref:acVLRF1 family peptidyl-tRNA hydrolase n=1 Tax=Ornithinimicrobium murale TaxID=1050153 RepID=UPI0013B3B381|nr:acVLRF1 family peptidyl-tRNA hydrolase [Ornithinimicrobium murale]
MSAGPGRVVEVDPARLDRWIEGFTQRHGVPERSVGDDPETVPFVLTAPDGAVAQVLSWAPGAVDLPARLGLVLLRRGGYAVGLADGDRLTDHYCGTRYVQSRTAAGGWSQQRYARRRGNQADALVERVVEQAADRLLTPQGPLVDALVVGGDKALVRQVLEAPLLAPLTDLPRREFYNVPDPRLKVLHDTLLRGRATRIRIAEPL